MSGFEGSYLGASDKISPRAIMECKICWTPYDPAVGDEYRQVDPGTAFLELPDDWSCPNCSAPKEQFMVLDDPGRETAAAEAEMARRTAALEADFREIYNAKMRDVPLVNPALHVEAVGFRLHEGRPLGVLIAPWFMNIVLLPGEEDDWSGIAPGTKDHVSFPSGEYEFLHNAREMAGGYMACSLFSPMQDFRTQEQARQVAEAVMVALFDEANRAETDRAADIRARREAELSRAAEARDAAEDGAEETEAGAEAETDPAPTRRQVLSGGLARRAGEG